MTETDTPCCRAAEFGQSCTCQMRLTNGDGTRLDWKAAWYALDADNRALLARAEKAEAKLAKRSHDLGTMTMERNEAKADARAAWNEAIEAAAKIVRTHGITPDRFKADRGDPRPALNDAILALLKGDPT